jgi:hypothetical protein
MNEALLSSETSVLTRATRRNTPEDVILSYHLIKNHVTNLNALNIQVVKVYCAGNVGKDQ